MSLSANFPAIRPSLLLDFANTKALDPRITFTRNTTATYYDGVTTAMAEQNLLTYSQEFDNAAWTKSGSSITANATPAPDGTTTADSLVEAAGGASDPHDVRLTGAFVNAVQQTLSVFAKQNSRTWLYLECFDTTNRFAYFDLATGVVGTSSGVTAAITASQNGFYRCSITLTPSATGNLSIGAATANGTRLYSGTAGLNAIYLWGAQLEQRSSVTAYTATTTQAITNYIPVLKTAAANVARFDHNPTTDESLGLLVEEQRTNVALYSEQFDNASWTKTAVTVTANSNVAPDGTVSADTLVEDTTATGHVISASSFTFAATTAYTASVYVKQAGRSWAFIQLSTTPFGATTRAWFDLANGVVGTQANCTGSIKAVGNGWYRCSVTATTTAGGVGNPPFTVQMATADNTSTYTGNGYSGIFLWGAQLEAGSSATSYIPTVATTVQRNADSATMTGTNFSSWYNAGEGTLYVNGTSLDSVSGIYAVLNNSTGSTRVIALARRVGNTGTPAIVANAAGTTLLNATNYAGTANDKAVVAYAANDFGAAVNGGSVSSASTGLLGPVSQMEIGRQTPLGSIVPGGTIKKIAYYPIRVTNAQLQALTS